ncbi:MAG: ferrous iron transport protein A [Synechococcaceae cyanobacterium]
MASSTAVDAAGSAGVDLAGAPEGVPLQLATLPADPVLRERLLALGLRPGEVVTVLRRGRPGGILHVAPGMTEFMLRRPPAADIRGGRGGAGGLSAPAPRRRPP